MDIIFYFGLKEVRLILLMVEKDDSESDTESDSDEDCDNEKPIDLLTFFTRKELCYYKMVDKFFKNCDKAKVKQMLEIIDGTSVISLRVLDWFITRYSKTNIELGLGDTDNLAEIFDVHISYKAQLKSFRKKYFDPFRRRKKKFNYYYDSLDPKLRLHTTLCQLNFFRWAIVHNIISYVEKHLDKILKEMNACNKEDKKKKDQKKKLRLKNIEKKVEKVQNKIVVNNLIDNNNIIINFN